MDTRRSGGGQTVQRLSVTITADYSAARAAMDELALLAESQPDAVRRFMEGLDGDGNLFCLRGDDHAAVGTFDVRAIFEPSDCLSEFLAAARAGQIL